MCGRTVSKIVLTWHKRCLVGQTKIERVCVTYSVYTRTKLRSGYLCTQNTQKVNFTLTSKKTKLAPSFTTRNGHNYRTSLVQKLVCQGNFSQSTRKTVVLLVQKHFEKIKTCQG